MGIRGKLLGGFLLITIMLMLVSGVAIQQLKIVKTNLEEMINVQLEMYDLSQKFALNISERSNSLRGYLLTGESQYNSRFQQLHEQSQELEQRFLDASDEQEVIRFVLNTKSWGRSAFDIIIPAYQQGSIEEAINYNNVTFNPKANEFVYEALYLAAESEQNLRQSAAEILALEKKVMTVVLGISSLAVILAIFLGMMLSRVIVNPLTELVSVVEKVAAGDLQQSIRIKSKDEVGKLGQAVNKMVDSLKKLIGDVHISSEQVAASAEELMASSEETSAASQQMAVSIQQIASGAEQQQQTVAVSEKTVAEMITDLQHAATNVETVKEVSQGATEISQTGAEAIGRAVQQMQVVSNNVHESAVIVTGLGSHSEAIGQIVEMISGIAEQTNLLALNAAIEAARAGEQGRGFAVVAEEVRKLAEQSGAATDEISELIAKIQTETAKAVASMKQGTSEAEIGNQVINEAGAAFEKVLENVVSVNGQIEEVSRFIKQIADGSHQVADQTRGILNTAQEAAASSQEVVGFVEEQTSAMEEIAKSSQQLTELAENMQMAVGQFKV